MKYWNVHDESLLYALFQAGAPSLDFARGPQGGVAVYRQKQLLGVWIEFQRDKYDYVPQGAAEATYKGCGLEQVVSLCSWIAAEAAAGSAGERPKLRVVEPHKAGVA